MNISDFLKNLELDTWYKAFMYIGGIALVASFFFEVKGITNAQLQLLSAGFFLWGVGEWINHKKESYIKPPNVYTGPTALITYTIRKPDFFGLLLDLAGIVLLTVGIWSVFTSPMQTPASNPGVVPTTIITSTATPSTTPVSTFTPVPATSTLGSQPAITTPGSTVITPTP